MSYAGGIGARARSERGQVLPITAIVMVALLAAGMLVFFLGFATSLSSNAQTAADASALAAEQKLLEMLSQPPIAGQIQPFQYDVQQACGSAGHYASDNDAQVVSCTPVSANDTMLGWDMEVTVRTSRTQPSGTPAAGQSAYAEARASTDPYSQASPAVETSQSATGPCQPSLTGSVFRPHGGQFGLFPEAGDNVALGCEAQLAAVLDQVGVGLHLHLIGISGFTGDQNAATPGTVRTAHACGAAMRVGGLSAISGSALRTYGLTRPFAKAPDQIELVDHDCSLQLSSTDSSKKPQSGFGNTNVHLVPMTGGPAVNPLLFSSNVNPILNESQLQVACQIYKVWQGLHVSQQVLFIGLLVAFDESQMGQDTGGNTTDIGQSVGVFQQIEKDGWGTIPDELNPTTAAEMFFLGAHNQFGSTTGLLTYYNADPGAPPWALAQKTQGSGAGQSSGGASNYGAPQNMAEAQQMQAQVSSGACAGA